MTPNRIGTLEQITEGIAILEREIKNNSLKVPTNCNPIIKDSANNRVLNNS